MIEDWFKMNYFKLMLLASTIYTLLFLYFTTIIFIYITKIIIDNKINLSTINSSNLISSSPNKMTPLPANIPKFHHHQQVTVVLYVL